MANEKKIDKKYLAGLVYRFADRIEEEGDDNRRTVRNVPTERELTPDDVLDWRDTGTAVIIVTADGRKITVEKKAEKGKE